MKRIETVLFFLALSTTLYAVTPVDVNLLAGGDFKPVMIQGECCGPQGWRVSDAKRFKNNFVYNKQATEYLSGRSFYEFKPIDNGMTFIFKKDCSFGMRDENGGQRLWAPSFRFTGEIKLNSGKVSFCGKSFEKAPDWRRIEFEMSKYPVFGINFEGVAGSEISLRNFRLVPEFGNQFGELNLPDGGVLRQIIVPANGTFLTFYNAEAWRGWLWKLSGKALPIKTIKPGDAVPKESFYIACDKTYPGLEPGGYYLNVNKDGAKLIVRRPQTIVCALYNYLREFGYRCYAVDEERIPPVDANLTLKKVDEIRNPHLTATTQRYFAPQAWFNNSKNGGYDIGQLLAYSNDAYELGWQRFVHTIEFLMPYGKYGKTHPEYFMQLKNGKRWAFTPDRSFRQVCLSNPEVKKIIADRVLDWMRSTPERIYYPINFDDGNDFCLCENCKVLDPDPNDDSVSDLNIDLVNYVAARTKEEFPDKKISALAYTENSERIPMKTVPAPNVDVTFCQWSSSFKCRLHVDCELNPGLNYLRQWSEIVPKENISFWNYTNDRDIKFESFDTISKLGNGYLYQDTMDDYQLFVIARWNWGMKMDDAIKEFCAGYYGKGGDAMYAAINYIDECAKNYKHTPEDKNKHFVTMFSSYLPCKSVLEREQFDKIYQFYNQALNAEPNDPAIRSRVLYEKINSMIPDFSKFPRSSAKTKEEVTAFALRAKDFVKSCQELYRISKHYAHRTLVEKLTGATKIAMRQFVNSYLGLQIPDSEGIWTETQETNDFINDLINTLLVNAKSFDGGWRWPLSNVTGGRPVCLYQYKCPPRLAKILRRPSSGEGTVSVSLDITGQAPEYATLLLTGQDDDKPGRAQIEVKVNGKHVFSGENSFMEYGWSSMFIPIEKGVLKQGENIIELSNVTPDKDAGKTEALYDAQGTYLGTKKKQDYNWGWIGLNGISLFTNDGDFTKWETLIPLNENAVAVDSQGVAEVDRHFRICGKKVAFDPQKVYRLSGKFRAVPGKEPVKLMFGLAYCDSNGEILPPGSRTPVKNGECELVDEALAGAKEIKIKLGSTSWPTGEFLVFNARKDLKDLPNKEVFAIAEKRQDPKDKTIYTIHLKRKLSKTYPANTTLRIHKYDGECALIGMKTFTPLTNQWQEFSETISGIAGKANILWDKNAPCATPIIIDYWHKGAEDEKIQFKDIKFEEAIHPTL